MLFAQLWGVGGVRILTFTVIPTPFMRTSGRVGAGLGAHFERSSNMPGVGAGKSRSEPAGDRNRHSDQGATS